MYGRRALQLLKEIDSSEAGQLASFNSDVFDQVIRECNEHNSQFQSLIRKMVEQNLDMRQLETRTTMVQLSTIFPCSVTKDASWPTCTTEQKLFRVLDGKLDPCFLMIFKKSSISQRKSTLRTTLQPLSHNIGDGYRFDISMVFLYTLWFLRNEIDLSDVLYLLFIGHGPSQGSLPSGSGAGGIGEVSLGDHSVSLTKNSFHFLRRTDAEQFISQGLMEEFLE